MMKPTHLLLTLACACGSTSSNAFELLGPKWKDGDVSVYTSISGTSPSGTSWSQSAKEAASKWAEPVNGLQISYPSGSSHPCAGYVSAFPEDGGKNATDFYDNACGDPFGTDVIAVTLSQNFGSLFNESDIVFNSAEAWDVYDGTQRSQLDFRRVAVHEFGHFIGLDHEESASAIMAPFIGNIFNPTTDDINGAKSLYLSSSTQPDPSTPVIRTSLEEPSQNQVASGITNIRGWAVGLSGINRVELYLDGVFATNIPYGGLRADVGNAFSDYNNANKSGFSMVYNWGNQSPGTHNIEIRAYDNAGNIKSQSSNYTVQAFNSSFISDPNDIEILSGATVTDPRTITLNQVRADGVNYKVVMTWNTASQKWDISEISQ